MILCGHTVDTQTAAETDVELGGLEDLLSDLHEQLDLKFSSSYSSLTDENDCDDVGVQSVDIDMLGDTDDIEFEASLDSFLKSLE